MTQKNLVWLDLEMTGLDVGKDTILEIATCVTTDNLEFVAQGPAYVIHQPEIVLQSMDDWNKNQHAKSGLWEKVLVSFVTMRQAEIQTLAFLKQYCEQHSSPLCGNSVYQDKAFLKKYMPELHAFFHYRIIDVSSIKEVVRRWYPDNEHTFFQKTEAHRALDDVYASIEELKHYRKYFFVTNKGGESHDKKGTSSS